MNLFNIFDFLESGQNLIKTYKFYIQKMLYRQLFLLLILL